MLNKYNLSECKCLISKWVFSVDENRSKVERKCKKCNTIKVIEKKQVMKSTRIMCGRIQSNSI